MNPQIAGFDSNKANKYLYGNYSCAESLETEVLVCDTYENLLAFNVSQASTEFYRSTMAPKVTTERVRQPRLQVTRMQSYELLNPLQDFISKYAKVVSSPFEELDSIRADDSAFVDILKELFSNNKIAFRTELKANLERLLMLYKEDYEGKSLSAQSLYGLVRFLSLSEISIQPAVTATANGDLYVQWKNEGHSLSVHFMGTFTAKYALVKPNQKHAEKWSYSSGATTVDALWEEMAVLRLPNGLLR